MVLACWQCRVIWWATAWMTDANAVIAPVLGLPELPVADLGELPGIDDPVWSEHDETAGLNWKTRGLVELAAGRPFAWVDDEITHVDRAWVAGARLCLTREPDAESREHEPAKCVERAAH